MAQCTNYVQCGVYAMPFNVLPMCVWVRVCVWYVESLSSSQANNLFFFPLAALASTWADLRINVHGPITSGNDNNNNKCHKSWLLFDLTEACFCRYRDWTAVNSFLSNTRVLAREKTKLHSLRRLLLFLCPHPSSRSPR